jgi:hypothetical protein
VIIGDSHAQGCAGNMKHNLKNSDKTIGFVKPGACIDTATGNIEYSTNEDIIVLAGGRNVTKNNSQGGLKYIVNFVEINSHTNIILVSVPHRYDLSDWSGVNNEVNTFNRKQVKLMKPSKHVMVVKVDLKSKFFTKQGLHVNNVDKEKIALKIANVVTTSLKKETEESISLHWKTEYDDDVSYASSEDNIII